MKLLDPIHGSYVHRRRVGLLANWFVREIPKACSVLDVGCGDGQLTRTIADCRPDVSIQGIDVFARKDARVPVEVFDGSTIPRGSGSFDFVMFVDVLHHTEDPMVLLREASRVACRGLLLKDHTADGWLAEPTLRFMDRVGNLRHGVPLPFNYWPSKRWQMAFAELRLRTVVWQNRLGLYPIPARWLFDRSLHFAARLETPYP